MHPCTWLALLRHCLRWHSPITVPGVWVVSDFLPPALCACSVNLNRSFCLARHGTRVDVDRLVVHAFCTLCVVATTFPRLTGMVDGWRCGWHAWRVTQNQAARPSMEDEVVAVDDLYALVPPKLGAPSSPTRPRPPPSWRGPVKYFAVYDGHAGRHVVDMLREQLHGRVVMVRCDAHRKTRPSSRTSKTNMRGGGVEGNGGACTSNLRVYIRESTLP